MTPVRQTVFAPDGGDEMPGNCLQAAMATLLDLPLTGVPHFVGDAWANGEPSWWVRWYQWCYAQGLELTRGGNPEPGEYYLGSGPSPRDPANRSHVAVYRDGHLVHDPHPSNAGVVAVEFVHLVRPLRSE